MRIDRYYCTRTSIVGLTENLCNGVVRKQRMAERKNIVICVEIINDILTKVRVEHKSLVACSSS